MSDDKKYNGWTNRETWLVALWVGNDEGLYHEQREMTRVAINGAEDKDEAQGKLADRVKDWITEMQPETTGLFADLMSTALGKVDWDEIAGSWVDDDWDDWKEEAEG